MYFEFKCLIHLWGMVFHVTGLGISTIHYIMENLSNHVIKPCGKLRGQKEDTTKGVEICLILVGYMYSQYITTP